MGTVALTTCSDCDAPRVGRRKRCDECQRVHDRERLSEWRAKNPERAREQSRRSSAASYGRDPKATKERAIAWQQANREAYNERLRQWRERNPGKAAVIARRHRQANPEGVREHTRRRQARLRGATVERVDYRAIAERDGWVCHLCCLPVDPTRRGCHPESVSFDHVIPLALGGEHSYSNVRLAHFGCNARKGARSEIS